MRRILPLALLALLLLPPAVAGVDLQQPAGEATSITLTFTVADHGPDRGDAARVLSLRALDGRRTRLQTGWRLPVPTAMATAADAATPPVTSFQYQDVGMTVAVECRLLADGRLRVDGQLEISAEGAARDAAPAPPTFRTLSHRFEVAVAAGEDTVLARIPDPAGGGTTLSVRASLDG